MADIKKPAGWRVIERVKQRDGLTDNEAAIVFFSFSFGF